MRVELFFMTFGTQYLIESDNIIIKSLSDQQKSNTAVLLCSSSVSSLFTQISTSQDKQDRKEGRNNFIECDIA